MDVWAKLFDILLLLIVAMFLGGICTRLRQSAIVGYLLAGVLLGPGALNVFQTEAEVEVLAELGVALLLFTIGLEFSWKRLKSLGAVAIWGGTLQILLTMGIASILCKLCGLTYKSSIAIGAMVSLSSTACVFRLLIDRAEIDSMHGRNVAGILLIQDIAIFPMVLLINFMGVKTHDFAGAAGGGFQALLLVPIFIGFWLCIKYVIPWALGQTAILRNHEMPILLAIVTALGAAWLLHRVNLSPALGAFVAGIMLGGSPFAIQIRSDIVSLRTLLVTLFFCTIGTLADPAWMADHFVAVILFVLAIVFGKTLVIWVTIRLHRQTHAQAIATGLCLAQVGEFSFVLAESCRNNHIIDTDIFNLIISATVLTFFLTPQLVGRAAKLGSRIQRLITSDQDAANAVNKGLVAAEEEKTPYIVIVGFGPAGQVVGGQLQSRPIKVTVIDMNARMISMARDMGFQSVVGEASHRDVLEHIHIDRAKMVIITIPDPQAVRRIISQVRILAPQAQIVARSRYHIYRWELEMAGAHTIIDEEEQVGKKIADEVALSLQSNQWSYEV